MKWDLLAKLWYGEVATEREALPGGEEFTPWDKLPAVEREFYTRTVKLLVKTYLTQLMAMLPKA